VYAHYNVYEIQSNNESLPRGTIKCNQYQRVREKYVIKYVIHNLSYLCVVSIIIFLIHIILLLLLRFNFTLNIFVILVTNANLTTNSS